MKAARDSKPAPEAAPAPRKPEVVENRFGQMVTDMLKSLEAQARDQHDTMVARLREKLDAAKDKPAAFAPRDVDAERKVAAYAKTGAPGLEQALSKKVA